MSLCHCFCLCICRCLFLCRCIFDGQIIFSHHSEQMSQRPQVSKIALWRCSLNVFVIVIVVAFVFLLIRSCFLITLINCLKGYKCLRCVCVCSKIKMWFAHCVCTAKKAISPIDNRSIDISFKQYIADPSSLLVLLACLLLYRAGVWCLPTK